MTNPSTEIVEAGEQSLAVLSPTEQRVLVLVEEFKLSFRRTLELSIDLGEALEAHKATLDHGEWMPWLEQHFELGDRMARRFMELYTNRKVLSDLPPGTSTDAAILWLRKQRRGPRPVRIVGVDAEAPDRPLLRGCGPDWSTGAIVKSIVLVSFPGARMALDVTYGNGNFWSEGAPIPVTGHDMDEARAPDGVMDFTDLKYDDATWDVVSFDPPHLADGGEDSVMTGRFGTVATQAALDDLIIDGVREAWRVCSMGVIVKVTNHVHGQTFQYEQALIEEALDWKIPYYDLVYQFRDHAFIDPSWGVQRSAYNNVSVYAVLKKGSQIH